MQKSALCAAILLAALAACARQVSDTSYVEAPVGVQVPQVPPAK